MEQDDSMLDSRKRKKEKKSGAAYDLETDGEANKQEEIVKQKEAGRMRGCFLGFILIFIVGLVAVAALVASGNAETEVKVEIIAAATTIQEFNTQQLQYHNMYRKKHGTEPLTLDPALTKDAQKWADELLKKGQLVASTAQENRGMGESLSMLTEYKNKKVFYPNATNTWYQQIEKFDYTNPKIDNENAKFTQLVWKATKKVGFGYAQKSDGTIYIVGRYEPAGNMEEKISENVLKA